MSQIEIKILKQGTSSTKVLSCSFFRMTSGYRDFSKYQTHFNRFLGQTRHLKDFETRVYVDNTTKDFCLKASEGMNHISIYHFDCPEFRDGEGHIGTFGTFARFLPLFEKGHDIVWISDIDVPDSFLDSQFVSILDKSNADVFIHNLLCYNRKPWTNVEHPILAGSFLSKIQFPKQFLTRFLNKLLQGTYDEVVSQINVYNTRKEPNPLCPYGIDEYFLNTVLYKYIAKHDIPVVIYKNYSIEPLIKHNSRGITLQEINILTKYYLYPSQELFKKVRDIYDKYIPQLIETYPCLTEYLENRDSFTRNFIKLFKTKLIAH